MRLLRLSDRDESLALRARYEELREANDQERRLLEAQLRQVIGSAAQAGQLEQRSQFDALQAALQEELTLSQSILAEREGEISWLKRSGSSFCL